MSAEIIDKVRKAVEARGINTVVIASRGGKKALKLSEDLGKGVKVVSVTEFSYGDDIKKKMKKRKVIPVEEADLVIQDSREVKEILLNIGTGVKAAMEIRGWIDNVVRLPLIPVTSSLYQEIAQLNTQLQ